MNRLSDDSTCSYEGSRARARSDNGSIGPELNVQAHEIVSRLPFERNRQNALQSFVDEFCDCLRLLCDFRHDIEMPVYDGQAKYYNSYCEHGSSFQITESYWR